MKPCIIKDQHVTLCVTFDLILIVCEIVLNAETTEIRLTATMPVLPSRVPGFEVAPGMSPATSNTIFFIR